MQYLDRLLASLEVEFVGAIHRWASILGHEPMRRMSLAAGCEAKVHFDEAISRSLKTRYGVTVEFLHTLRAEIKQPKRKFLRQQFGGDAGILVNDMAELHGHIAVDIADEMWPRQVLVPYVFSLATGIVCTSRTPLSGNMPRNLNCVQEGRDATGECTNMAFDAIDQHHVAEVSFECVKGLCQEVDADTSDAQWITDQLKARKFWAVHIVLNQLKWGASGKRIRL